LEKLLLQFNWQNLGLVFDLAALDLSPDWHISHAQAPNVVDMGDFVRVYFCGRQSPDDSGNFVSLGMYADVIPGESFRVLEVSQTPILDLGGLGEFDEFGTYPISVIRNSVEFLAYYGGWSRPKDVPFDVALGLATSVDGKKFVKFGNGPVLSATPNEPFVITSPKIRHFQGKYVLAYTSGVRWFDFDGRKEIIYRNRIAFSNDGKNWNRLGREIIQTKIGHDEAQACPDIYAINGEYHMFFCYRSSKNFRDDPRFSYKLGYAHSTNLVDWHRDDSKSVFLESQENWDSEMQAYPNVFDFKGKTYMLYLGNGTGVQGFGAAIRVENNG
jgi:predicted GH43/DUF377 family glycosyl hydrolase